MPYNGIIINNEWWIFYASSNKNPVFYMLDLVWTRLHYRFNLSQKIFGDDQVEQMHEYLHARIFNKNGIIGWGYQYIHLSPSEMEIPLATKEWEPICID